MFVPARKPAALLLLATIAACGDGTASSENAGGAGGTAPQPQADEGVYDFLATELNFYYPEGLGESDTDAVNPCGLDTITDNTIYRPLLFDDVIVDGFDLDGAASTGDGGLCPQADYTGIDGLPGVDYAFLGIIDMIRPIRPDQVARGVLANAPSEGLINFGIRLSGVESLENDDSIEVFVAPTTEVPLRGTDGRIIPRSSVPIDPNPAWQNTFRGQILDGVLTTEPADFTLGNINLIIVFDRVLELKDARIRATFEEVREGVIEVDSILAGWWATDNMIETIGEVVLAIGANDGELQCSAEMWADGSSDGTSCDMTSMIFKTVSVSGFLTGFEDTN